jgi:acetate kinase
MKILAVNCGSSSIKYKLYDSQHYSLLTKGIIERIGEKGSEVKNHASGIKKLVGDILKKKVVQGLDEIEALGHRVVHGAESFSQPRIIDNKVIKKIKDCSSLAPLHNPANLAGIVACQRIFSKIPQVAVFDTAFHQSIPRYAYMYALPQVYYTKYKVRKYGFHGASHQFVAGKASKLLKKPLKNLKLITCHLGNGCSITAIDKGKSVDNSMGFTPLQGLMMGTRSGDVDVAAVFHIMKKKKLSLDQMNIILNKKSGFLGISRLSNDFRAIQRSRERGNRWSGLAYDMFSYRIKKYIGAYYFILGGIDAVCFTGGIGENAQELIHEIKRDIVKVLGRRIKVLVIPTDEELTIAKLTNKLVVQQSRAKVKKK